MSGESHTPSFAVVIPMFNEEAGVEACVKKVCTELDRLSGRSALLVVNDGSGDRTGEILHRLAPAHPKLKVVTHPANRGYGRALRSGVEEAARGGYDYVLFMDSDLTNDPADIPRFFAEMARGKDVIKASRFAGHGGMNGVPLRRALISRLGNRIARALFSVGVRDCTNGFRAVRVALLAQMNLRENGFPIIVEELYQLKFVAESYAEVPVVLTSRKADQRPTSFAYKPATFCKYFWYAAKARLGVRPKTGLKI
jgi:dolichol-phosphate mannosyltransferase